MKRRCAAGEVWPMVREGEQAVLSRLRKIEGQLRGIQRMIEDGRDCESVLTQLISARSALDRAAAHVVTTYIGECIAERPPDEAKTSIARAVHLLSRVG
jgi:CsoR family transcriptional regulator, copper-sensing transcriptional repressor